MSSPQPTGCASLRAILQRRKPDGASAYTAEDIKAVAVLFLLPFVTGGRWAELLPEEQALMLEFVQALSLKPQASAKEVQEAVANYFKAKKVNPLLLNELKQWVQEELGSRGNKKSAAGAAAFTRFVGQAPVLPTTPNPTTSAGTVKGSAMARFQLDQITSTEVRNMR